MSIYENIRIEDHFSPETVRAIDTYHDARGAYMSAMTQARITAEDAVNAGLVAAKSARGNPSTQAEAIRKELAKSEHLRDAATIAEVGLLHLLEQAEPLVKADWMGCYRDRQDAVNARVVELNKLADDQGYPVKSASRASLIVNDDRRRGLEQSANAARSSANTNLITEEIRQRHEEAVRELLARFRV